MNTQVQAIQYSFSINRIHTTENLAGRRQATLINETESLEPSSLNTKSLDTPIDYELVKDVTVWRCISSGRRHGHWEYLFDDHVLETSLGKYLAETSRRGSQRISLYRMGPFRDVLGSSAKKPMGGTVSIAHERLNHKLEEWSDILSEKEYTDAFK